MNERLVPVALALLVGLAPASGGAQSLEVSTSDLEVPEGAAMEASGPELRLSLDQAVEIALHRNLQLLVQRFERQQFRLRVDENLGIFDVNLDGSVQSRSETSPTVSALVGAAVLTEETQNLNLKGSQLTPWGGTVSGTFNVFRRDSNDADARLNPFYFSDLDLTVTQPLLRNFGKLPTKRGILVARLNSAQSLETFEQQVASTIQQVENAYWTLIESRSQLDVAKEGLDLAKELHDMNKIRVDVGTLAPLELIQSEVGISTRQEEIIRAEAAVHAAEDSLRELLNFDEGELWSIGILPVTEPEVRKVDIDLQDSFRTALTERPELASKKLEVQTLEIDQAYYRNQKMPRLDLSATYGYNGLGGDAIGFDGTKIPGGFNDAWQQIQDRDFDGWEVQLTFGFPIQNRAAKARYTIADLNLSQGEVELTRLEQQIRTEVRAAVRDLRTAAQQIESAQASRRLAEENLDAERKRYENGLSTSFQVLQIQEDLTQARSREVTAVATYNRAQVEYQRAIGKLLESNGVELMETSSVE